MATTTLIRGENMVLMVGGKPVGCARTCSLNKKVNIIGKTTVGSGTWKESKAVSKEWSVTSDGLAKVVDATNNTYPDLVDIADALNPVTIGYTITDRSGNTFNQYGEAIIVELNASGSVNNVGVYNVTLQGTGPLYRLLPPEILNVSVLIDGDDSSIVHVTTIYNAREGAIGYDLRYGHGDTVVATMMSVGDSPYTFDGNTADFPGGSWVQMRAVYPGGSSEWSEKFDI